MSEATDLTPKEIQFRDWLITQPGGSEWWMVVKSGFQRSYDLGVKHVVDKVERKTLARDTGDILRDIQEGFCFDSEAEALGVIRDVNLCLELYVDGERGGFISINDLFDRLGAVAPFSGWVWGWTEPLPEACVRQASPSIWHLEFPTPTHMREAS